MALKQKHAAIKYKLLLKRLDFVYKSSQETDKSKQHLFEFRAGAETIDSLENDLLEYHVSIEADDADGFDQEVHDASFQEFHAKIQSIKAKYAILNESQRNFDSRNTSLCATNSHGSAVRLPPVKLPTFSGELDRWSSFFSLFSSLVHNDSNLSDVQRLYYLLSSLSGEPLRIVSHLELSDGNYDVCLTLLKSRYENKRLIADQYLHNMINLPIVMRKAEQLRNFITTINESVKALTALGFPTEEWSFLLLHIFLKKIDTDTRTRFEIECAGEGNDIPTFTEFLSFLNAQCRALESVKSEPQIKQDPVKASGSKRVSFHVERAVLPHEPQSRARCPHCNDPQHYIYKCPSFANLPHNNKLNFIREKRLCTNCLKPHPVNRCTSTFGCKFCGSSKHHTVLHRDGVGSSAPPRPNSPVKYDNTSAARSRDHTSAGDHVTVTNAAYADTCAAMSAVKSTVLLGTAMAMVMDSSGSYQKVRILIDPGSQSSFITSSCAESLGLRSHLSDVNIRGIAGGHVSHPGRSVQMFMKPIRFSGPVLSAEALLLDKITSKLPSAPLPADVLAGFNLPLADDQLHKPREVDILVGADLYPDIVTGEAIKLGPNLPTAFASIFGYLLIGRANIATTKVRNVMSSFLVQTPSLETILERFWKIEEPPQAVPDQSDVLVEKSFVETHTRHNDGRFVVRLPFVTDRPALGDSRHQALKRFLAIERKLARDPLLKELYVQFMQEYRDLGDMTLVSQPPPADQERYYIPHHGILKHKYDKPKIRTVFDASMPTTSGVSLNQCLAVGPKLQQDIRDILLQFRTHRFVFTTDIKMMFRRILVHPEDRRFQMILWRDSPDLPIQEYFLNTVTYGETCSPFLAMRCLHQLAHENELRLPQASHAILHDIFVDDILTGSNSIEAAQKLKSDVISLLSLGGFELRKWSSNSPELLQDLPGDHCEVPLDFDTSDDQLFLKVLGVQWSPKDDTFSYAFQPVSSGPCTKRSILSTVARIFDPCGWLSPVVFRAKLLLQQLWLVGAEWDESPPEHIVREWDSFLQGLPGLCSVKINRFILTQHSEGYSLHGFCDASSSGYACAVYLRVIDHDRSISTHLLMGKTKVAPIKTKLTIPKLELCAALLLARTASHIRSSLTSQVGHLKLTCWSDSTVALSWLKTSPHILQVFESNRVSQIIALVDPEVWRYVPTKLNPVDCASRGIPPEELLNHELWWAPSWLSKPDADWPKNLVPPVSDKMAGIRRISLTACISSTATTPWIENYSSLDKIVNVTSWCLRFISNLKFKAHLTGPLSISERASALIACVRFVQHSEFADDFELLAKGKNPSTRISKLFPYVDASGILRVGGRIRYSTLPEERKHPILLPRSHHLTKLIIQHYHKTHFHCGPSTLQAILARRFWILSARRAIRHQLSLCRRCFRLAAAPKAPPMADLPPCRVEQVRPFLRVSTDFGGPFLLKSGPHRNAKIYKAYLCVFVCLATKAVHLEVVPSLTTDDFLSAFFRFTSRRGFCADLYSDCGTNYIGARRYLDDVTKYFRDPAVQHNVSDVLLRKHVTFHNAPPTGPHFNGLAEAAIKSAKSLLKRVAGDSRLTFSEMSTLFAGVEAVLNSRPLCVLSASPAETDVLTPGHLLIGEPFVAVLEKPQPEVSLHLLSRYRMLRSLINQFWRRWHSEYLNTLQQRAKWLKSVPTPRLDDIVLIKDDNAPPLHWALGRIIELCPGKDGIVRVVRLKTQQGILTRPMVKVVVVPQPDPSASV